MEEVNKYQVCVLCYTYNHALYIADALESFVKQKTNFPFVIVVVDDASSDGEPEVIRDYINNHFNVYDKTISYTKETDLANVIYAQHSTNKNCYIAAVLLKKNFYKELNKKDPLIDEWRNQSKYEALCEGDDWWLSEEKLQRQYDALESHPEVDMCACETICYKNGIEVSKKNPLHVNGVLPIEDVILGGGGYLGVSSLMLRVIILSDEYNLWRYYRLDFFLQIHGALRGGIYYIADSMAAYRLSSPGSWSVKMSSNADKRFYHVERVNETLGLLDMETMYRYHSVIQKKKALNYRYFMISGLSSGILFKSLNFKYRLKTLFLVIKNILRR